MIFSYLEARRPNSAADPYKVAARIVKTDRFYRVDTIQQHFPGMGIGLYVCEQIIKNHGGSIWVDSEPGKGSTFSFTLPLNLPNNTK